MMHLMVKLKNKISRYCRIDCLKSFLLWYKTGHKRDVRCSVYPNTMIIVDGMIEIENGELSVNASWTRGRKRRNMSSLIISKGSRFHCEGDFSLYQGASIFLAPNAVMRVRGGSFINTNTVINCFKYIEIGKGAFISDDVRIQDSDNHFVIENGIFFLL